jgi:hypothetical protein
VWGATREEERVDFVYSTDLPDIPRPKVTQYRVWVCRCTACGKRVLGEDVTAPVPALAAEHYRAAARWVATVAGRPDTRERCRRVAERYFDLEAVGGERYWALYRSVAEEAGATTGS